MASPYKRFLDIADDRLSGKRPRSHLRTPSDADFASSGSPISSLSMANTDGRSECDEDTLMRDDAAEEDMITLGMLCNIRGRACSLKELHEITFQATGSSDSNLTPLSTSVGKDNSVLRSDCGKKLVYLNSRTHFSLQKVSAHHDVSYRALVNVTALKTAITEASRASRQQKQSMSTSKIHEVTMDVLVSCASHLADAVARVLAKCMLFLQHPHLYTTLHPYRNPQYLDIPGASFSAGSILPPLSRDLLDAHGATKTCQATTNSDDGGLDPSRLLDTLPIPEGIQAIDIDDRIKTVLLDHQKRGVDFVTRRERLDLPQRDLWRRDSTKSSLGGDIFLHRITGARRRSMDDFRGGLLADDMGLGKTLTMIAAIVCTQESAEKHAMTKISHYPLHVGATLIPVKTTLVLVPSALLMDVWAMELEQHVQPGSLKIYRYHGHGRRLDQSKALPYDVVLSTYATVTSDYRRGGGVLSKFTWYRLILDEAHVIRNWSTKQFSAVYTISATIRWCLTGTPIQNNVGDLGSLVKFLKVPIFSDTAQFRKYISGIKTKGSVSQKPNVPNMKLMLTSMCLRRNRDILALPGVHETVHETNFTRQERVLYDSRVEILKKSLLKNANLGPKTKGSSRRHFLESILRLRIFCNVGLVGDLEVDQLFSLLQQEGDTNCQWCDALVGTMDEGSAHNKPRITHCCYVVCGDCIDGVEKSRKGPNCPICHRAHEGNIFSDFGGQHDLSDLERSKRETWPSKLIAVVHNLSENLQREKSIVFSFWRQSLDILGQLLSEREIPFSRIDGKVHPNQRKKILSDFGAGSTNQILLMTLGTGAVGLNDLSVASRVHFLEPQWNPSVESQAIGRVIRLGQERQCHIVRYIMKGSIEKSIQERQFIKLELAAAGGLYSGPKADRSHVDKLWIDWLQG